MDQTVLSTWSLRVEEDELMSLGQHKVRAGSQLRHGCSHLDPPWALHRASPCFHTSHMRMTALAFILEPRGPQKFLPESNAKCQQALPEDGVETLTALTRQK